MPSVDVAGHVMGPWPMGMCNMYCHFKRSSQNHVDSIPVCTSHMNLLSPLLHNVASRGAITLKGAVKLRHYGLLTVACVESC
jgi:hypothetical protein